MIHPKFSVGDAVSVSTHSTKGHKRTPSYVQGLCGTVQKCCGAFPNPEQRAHGQAGLPVIYLYRVRFSAKKIWPEKMRATPDHSVDVEIYEHWLNSR